MPPEPRARNKGLAGNAAFFLGAFGASLGAIGGVLALLGIAAAWWPGLPDSVLDWVVTAAVIVLSVLVVGLWPALDWLVNRSPRLGSRVMTGLATGLVAIGTLAIAGTAWAFAGWLALAGGALLLAAAYLAAFGGGTIPLTWEMLRTGRVRAVEARLDKMLVLLWCVVVVAFVVAASSAVCRVASGLDR